MKFSKYKVPPLHLPANNEPQLSSEEHYLSYGSLPHSYPKPADRACSPFAFHQYFQTTVPSKSSPKSSHLKPHSNTQSLWQSCPLISLRH